MNLQITLTEEQRTELQESATHLAKLHKSITLVDKQCAEYEAIKVKATAKLATMEKTALEKAGTEAGEAASEKVFGIRHQLGQLNLTLRRLEREFAEQEKEAAQAAFIARTEIRAAHRPLVESITAEAAELLTPFHGQPVHARQMAESLPAVAEARFFIRPNMGAQNFRTSGSILGDIEAIGRTIAAMLAGEAVVTVATTAEEGALSFPLYC